MVSSGGVAAATRVGAARPAGAAVGRPASLSTLGPVSPTSISTTRSPVSPPNPGQSPGGQSQHEVLQNFFQSLLSTKDRTGNVSRGAALSPTRINGTSTGTTSNGVVEEGS
jgi:dynein light intermediate chain 1